MIETSSTEPKAVTTEPESATAITSHRARRRRTLATALVVATLISGLVAIGELVGWALIVIDWL